MVFSKNLDEPTVKECSADSGFTSQEVFWIQMERLRRVLPGDFEIVQDGQSIVFGGRRIPVREGIVRFREGDGYNDTFALQWKEVWRDPAGPREQH